MKKNVLVLGCKNYPPFSSNRIISGGMEVYVWELMKHLEKSFDFTIIAGYSRSSSKSVKVISVPLIGGFALQPISLLCFSFFIALGLLFNKKKIDLVNAQTPLSGLTGLVLKKLFSIPYIVSVHIFASTKEHVGGLAGLYGIVEKIVLSDANKIVCAGYKLREHLIEKYNLDKGRIIVIHPGMDLIKNTNVVSSGKVKEVLKDKDSFKLLFLGRLVEENGIMDLLEAITYLKEKSIKLIIAGNGNLENEINNYIKKNKLTDKIKLVGIITGQNKNALLPKVDLLIRTSYHEVFPVAYLEAMAFGIPVIATPVGDTEYLATKSGAIKLVPIGDPKAIAKLIGQEINVGKLSPKIVQRCEKYIQGISWKVQADKTFRIYTEAMEYFENE